MFTCSCLTLCCRETPKSRSKPLLAESYKIVNDKTWEFKLRKGVKFHNGEDFNAAAVKFVLERMADPKLKLRQTVFQGVIDRVDVMDDYTFRIVTPRSLIPLWMPCCAFTASRFRLNISRRKGRLTLP